MKKKKTNQPQPTRRKQVYNLKRETTRTQFNARSFTEQNFNNLSDVKKFDYLLGMSMWMLTDERKNELLRQRDVKLTELKILKKKTNKDLWKEDLDAFSEKLDSVEEKERQADLGSKPKGSKKLLVCIHNVTNKLIVFNGFYLSTYRVRRRWTKRCLRPNENE